MQQTKATMQQKPATEKAQDGSEFYEYLKQTEEYTSNYTTTPKPDMETQGLRQKAEEIDREATPVKQTALTEPTVTVFRGNDERLLQTVHGLALFKDESGSNPKIVIENVPRDWVHKGTLRLNIALGLKNEDDESTEIKPVPEPLHLGWVEDRRYNNKMRKAGRVEKEYVQIKRDNYDNTPIEVPLTKAITLSRKFQGNDKELPLMYIHVQSECKTKNMFSDFFVVMSKRQKHAQKRGASSALGESHSSKRQKRSDEIKALASNNHALTTVNEQLSLELKRKTNENTQMVNLIKQLQAVAKVGLNSSSPQDVLQCFNAALYGTTNFHWMKDIQAPQTTALGGSRMVSPVPAVEKVRL